MDIKVLDIQIAKMACAFGILWANQMHRACKFFKFYAKNKVKLAWPLYNIF